MVTRLYLSANAGSTPISPTPSTDWINVTPYAGRAMCYPASKMPIDGDATAAIDDDSNNDENVLMRQFISDELDPGQVIGNAISAQMRAQENTVSQGLSLAIGVRIIAKDGTTVRKILQSVQRTTLNISHLTLTNRSWSPLSGGSTYTTLYGDRIVIEIGVGGDPFTGFHASFISFGYNGGPDLPVNDTTTTILNPWVEFSDDIKFGNFLGSSVKIVGNVKILGNVKIR